MRWLADSEAVWTPSSCCPGQLGSGWQRPRPGTADVLTLPKLSYCCPMASSCLKRVCRPGPGVCQGPRCGFASIMAKGSSEHVTSGLGCHSWVTEVSGQSQWSCLVPCQWLLPENPGERRKQSSGRAQVRRWGGDTVQQPAVFPACWAQQSRCRWVGGTERSDMPGPALSTFWEGTEQ